MGVPAGMRLTEAEVAAIKRIVAEHFGPDAEVRVFGSRTRPEVLGGDLDLHVVVRGPAPGLRVEGEAKGEIEDALDELPVDLTVTTADAVLTPFEREAMRSGVIL